jgi:hypothetical protein
MTNKSHKINRNWQGQRLLPAAPLLGGIIRRTFVSASGLNRWLTTRSSAQISGKPGSEAGGGSKEAGCNSESYSNAELGRKWRVAPHPSHKSSLVAGADDSVSNLESNRADDRHILDTVSYEANEKPNNCA